MGMLALLLGSLDLTVGEHGRTSGFPEYGVS